MCLSWSVTKKPLRGSQYFSLIIHSKKVRKCFKEIRFQFNWCKNCLKLCTIFFTFIYVCFMLFFYHKIYRKHCYKAPWTQSQMNSIQEWMIYQISNISNKKRWKKCVIKTAKPGKALWITSDQEQTS